MAANIQVLPPGSVRFDEVTGDVLQGVVKKPVIRSFTHGRGKETETKQGEITYMADMNGCVCVCVGGECVRACVRALKHEKTLLGSARSYSVL